MEQWQSYGYSFYGEFPSYNEGIPKPLQSWVCKVSWLDSLGLKRSVAELTSPAFPVGLSVPVLRKAVLALALQAEATCAEPTVTPQHVWKPFCKHEGRVYTEMRVCAGLACGKLMYTEAFRHYVFTVFVFYIPQNISRMHHAEIVNYLHGLVISEQCPAWSKQICCT